MKVLLEGLLPRLVPDMPFLCVTHEGWTAKLAQMGRQGVRTYSRPLHYHRERVAMADGSQVIRSRGREKGLGAGDEKMVTNTDANDLSGFGEAAGEGPVLAGRCDVAGAVGELKQQHNQYRDEAQAF